MSEAPAFQAAIDRLLAGARAHHRLALLCSEGDPHDCHRRLLVGKVLAERGAVLRHILTDGVVLEEREVNLTPAEDQAALFGGTGEEPRWRSTRSVSRRRRPRASSAA
jgi:Domain of unknown function DUF488